MNRIGKVLLCLCLAIGLLPVSANANDSAEFVTTPAIAQGYYHSLGLGSDGSLWAWGNNQYGQLGNNSTVSRSGPVQTAILSEVAAVAAGVRYSLALKQDGTVWAWGQNDKGELGDGTVQARHVPVQVAGLSGMTRIAGAVGYHALGLKDDGTVRAWGLNESGQLGDGTSDIRLEPVNVTGLTDVVDIASGGYFSLALKRDGTVWSWGHNGNGELGDGTLTQRLTPVQVSGLTDIVGIAAGVNHALALKNDGTVWAWGENSWGAVGLGYASAKVTTPVQVVGLTDVTKIAGGGFHSVALKNDGTVWSWGLNNQNQLGNGTSANASVPVRTANLDGVIGIAAGGYSSLALRDDGWVWAWGLNTSGQLGDNTATVRPAPVQSRAALDITAPIAANPEITAVFNGNPEVELSWEKALDNISPQNLLSYAVYLSTEPDIESVTAMETRGARLGGPMTDANQFLATGLNVGETYYFNVLVRDVRGNKRAYEMVEAVLSARPTYSMGYAGNGHQTGSPPVDSTDYDQGDVAVILGNDGELAREGYIFYGWNTSEDGSGTSYQPGDHIVMGSETVTLYAEWRLAPNVNGNLQSLVLGTAEGSIGLTPAFSPERLHYEALAPYAASTVTVAATAVDSGSTVTVSVYGNDNQLAAGPIVLASGAASEGLPLSVGVNTIELEVKAEEGGEQAYTIEVTRQPAPNPPQVIYPIGITEPKLPLLINGQRHENALRVAYEWRNGLRSAFLRLSDGELLDKVKEQLKESAELSIAVPSDVDMAQLTIDGSVARQLASHASILILRVAGGSYSLPMGELVSTDSREASSYVLKVGKAAQAEKDAFAERAAELHYLVLAEPVHYEIIVDYGDESSSPVVDRFSQYVERMLPLLPNYRPTMSATGVVVESTGELRHAPTRIVFRDGEYAAVIHSLSNSSYAVIAPAREPLEEGGHWASNVMADMAARLILPWEAEQDIDPNGFVTREEFVSTLLNALGAGASFDAQDNSGEPGSGTFVRASEYGLVTGYGDGSFRPAQAVSRAEAMVLIARAMELTGLPKGLWSQRPDTVLRGFADGAAVPFWAREAAASSIHYGIFQGYRDKLAFDGNVTRAEMAVILRRLLVRSGLIDELQNPLTD